MKISKKLLGAAMSFAVLGSQVMPVLATSTPPSTTSGSANILDYEVETVVVPTTLKIALNPNGYPINTKYVKATSFTTGTVYYTEAGGVYTKAATQPDASTDFSTSAYYTAVTSNSQIVSLNYGIANKSTGDKNVAISFVANYTADTDATKKAIQFVDSATKTEAYDATNKPEGAKSGEHKIYLAVASADDLPTANTHKKTADTTLTSGKTYYTKAADGSFTEVASPDVDDIEKYYEDTTDIGVEITAAELSDVDMDAATVGVQAFAAGATNKADASIAYKLGKATYALKDGEKIEFDTTQAELATKLEMSVLGGVAGFTLTGAINADADWTKADTASITITPTYTITDATGTETVVDSGAYNQVTLGPTLATTSYTIDASNSPITITLGNLGDETIVSVVNTDANMDLVARNFATVSGATVTLPSNYLRYINAGVTAPIKITTSGGTELTCTVTRAATGG